MAWDRTPIRHSYVIILYAAVLLCSYYDVISTAEVEYLDNYDDEVLLKFSEAVSMAMDMTIQEHADVNSDLTHLGFETEDPEFVQQLLEESPYKDDIIKAANFLIGPDYDVISPEDYPDVDQMIGSSHVSGSTRVKRTAIHSNDNLWPRGRITYVLTVPVKNSALYRDAINEALAHIEEVTCVKFREGDLKTIDRGEGRRRKYVKFVRGTLCHSSVGRLAGVGAQEVSLSRSCAYPEMVIHELGHLLGLWHEHARIDRDNNVLVLINNVGSQYQHNFEKVKPMRLIAPYDLSSMMHYTMNTFTASGEPTLTPMDPDLSFLIGQKRRFSFYDIYTLNKLYNCSEGCRAPPTCENGGFVIQNCSCMCPDGLTGTTCDRVVTDPECGGVFDISYGTVVTSPGYPDNYLDGVECRWLIKSPQNTVMSVTIPEIDMEKSRLGTCRDQLEIRYHNIGTPGGPVYCGQSVNRTFTTLSNLLLIRFSSNFAQTGRGFKVVIATKPKIDCASNPCQHGGRCEDIPAIGTYFCDCPDNWVGHNCEKEIRNGNWAQWSPWSSCIAPCGTQSRSRTCTDPEPHNGGRNCDGQHYESRNCGTQLECEGAYVCNFGVSNNSTMCSFIQDDESDRLDWQIHHGPTSSQNTGPITGHTTGEDSDSYLYLEASFGKPYDDAIIWFPPHNWKIGLHCLQFFYSMRGKSMGSLIVLRKISSKRAVVMWQRTGDQGTDWQEVNINILFFRGVQLGMIAVRGDTYSSDIAIDDLSISPGPCNPIEDQSNSLYGCIFDGLRRRVGPFTVTDGCIQMNCFCNPDGFVDCPQWQNESVCDIMELTEDVNRNGRKRWKPSRGKTYPKNWTSKKSGKDKNKKKQNTSGITPKQGLDRKDWPHWIQVAARRRRIKRRYKVYRF